MTDITEQGPRGGALIYTESAYKSGQMKARGACVRSGLYASHPSAVPVVRQMVKALDLAAPYFTHNNQVTAAIAAGQKFIKESGK